MKSVSKPFLKRVSILFLVLVPLCTGAAFGQYLEYGGSIFNGQQIPGGPKAVDGLSYAQSVTVSADGQFVYAAASGDRAVSVFKKSGDSLVYVTCFKDGQNGANSVTVSADGQYVYTVALGYNALSVFKKSGDSLMYVTCLKDGQNGVDGLDYAWSVTVSADGQYVYVAAWDDDAVSIFKKSGDSLVYVHCLKDGQNGVDGLDRTRSVTVSADGQYVYVAASGDNAVSVFKKRGDSLVYVHCLKDGQNGVDGLGYATSVTVSADGQYVYVAAWDDNAVSVFKKSGDSLVYVHCLKDGQNSVDRLYGATSVTVSADGQYVYAAAGADDALSVFKKRGDSLVYVHCLKDDQNGVDGLLYPSSVTVSADGQYVYAAAEYDDALSVFKKRGDSLVYITCLKDGENGVDGLSCAYSVTVSADGQFVYVAAWGDDAVSVFKKSDDSLVYVCTASKTGRTAWTGFLAPIP